MPRLLRALLWALLCIRRSNSCRQCSPRSLATAARKRRRQLRPRLTASSPECRSPPCARAGWCCRRTPRPSPLRSARAIATLSRRSCCRCHACRTCSSSLASLSSTSTPVCSQGCTAQINSTRFSSSGSTTPAGSSCRSPSATAWVRRAPC